MAGSGLTEREAISRITDGAELVDGFEDREQVQIKTAQVEHDAARVGTPEFSGPRVLRKA